MARCFAQSRHFLCGSSHATLRAQIRLWLAPSPLLAPTPEPCSKIALFQDHLPHRRHRPQSKREGGCLNRCLHSHLVKNYLCIPLLPSPSPSSLPLSFRWPSWQALPLAYTATTSCARERCHITAAKKHRHSSTFSRDRQRKGAGPSFIEPKRRRIQMHNETETKARRCCLGEEISSC